MCFFNYKISDYRFVSSNKPQNKETTEQTDLQVIGSTQGQLTL